MADVVVAEFMDEAAIAAHLAGFDVLCDPGLVDRPGDLAAAVADARALIVRNRTQVRGALLDAARALKVVGRLGVGLDNIDTVACAARGIRVVPATGANDVAVAEYVITTAMMLLRGAYRATGEVAAGDWPRNRLMGREIMGRTLGLIGFGAIARETAKRAAALGCRIVAHDPFIPEDAAVWTQPWGRAAPVALSDLLETADIVSLHVPLTDSTQGLIGAQALHAMKPDAVLVNAARGGVVDEAALAEALRAGRIGGAALDVFAREPLTAEGGALFEGCPNLILTPHIAGVSTESNVRVSDLIARSVRAALAG